MQSVKSSVTNVGLVRPQAVGPELEHLVEDRAQLFFDDYTEYDVTDVTKSVLSFSFLDRINVDIFNKYLPNVDRSGGLTEKLGLRHRRLNVPGVVGSASSMASSSSFAGSSAVSVASTPRHGLPGGQDASAIPAISRTVTVEEGNDDEKSTTSRSLERTQDITTPAEEKIVEKPDIGILEDAVAQTKSVSKFRTKPNAIMAKVGAAPASQARKILEAHQRRRFDRLHMDRYRNVSAIRGDRPKTTGAAGKKNNEKKTRPPVTANVSDSSSAKNPVDAVTKGEYKLSPFRSGCEDVQIGKNRLVVRSPGQHSHIPGLSVTLKGESASAAQRPSSGQPNATGAPSNSQVPVFSQTNLICPICGTHKMDNAIILRCGHQFCRSHLEAVQTRVRVNLCEEMANPVRFNVVCPLCGDSFCYQGDALMGDHPTDNVSSGQFLPVHSRDVTTYLGPLKMDWQSSI